MEVVEVAEATKESGLANGQLTRREPEGPLSPVEVVNHKNHIQATVTELKAEVQKNKGLLADSVESNGSAYSFHMADAGTDAMEREKLYTRNSVLMRRINILQRVLSSIERGHIRCGVCDSCRGQISRTRLDRVPEAIICCDCAKLREASMKAPLRDNRGRTTRHRRRY